MKKRIKKWFTFSLALVLVLGSINYSPLRANATTESTISGNDVSGNDVSGNDVSVNDTDTVSGNSTSEAGKAQMLSVAKIMTLSLSDSSNLLDGEAIGGDRTEDKYLYANSDAFSSIGDRWSGSTDYYERDDVNKTVTIATSSKYTELLFTLGEAVEASSVEAISFAMSEYTGAWAYKVYVDGTEKYANYDVNAATATDKNIVTIPISETEGSITAIAVMSNTADSAECTFDGVMIDMKGASGDNEPVTNITPAGDGVDDASYKAAALSVVSGSSATYTKTSNEQLEIGFASQYNELKLTLPETIDMLQCSTVTFAVSSQDAPLAFKLYNENGAEIFVKYDQTGSQLYKFEVSSSEKVKYIGVMLNQKLTNKSCVFDGVMFELDGQAETETYTITYAANELTLDSSQAESCKLENGNYMIKFSDKDQNVNFKLPASVNLEKCINITFNVASQNGPMNFNVGLDKTKLKDYWYNTGKTSYTVEPGITSKINEVGVQCGRENDAYVPGAFIELVSVSFLMKGTEPKEAPADNNYSMDYFEVTAQSDSVTMSLDENDAAEITFPNAGDSITLLIPDSVDVNHLVSIDFVKTTEFYSPTVALSASALSGELLAKNLLASRTTGTTPEILVEILDDDMQRIVSTLTNSVETHCNPEAKYIRLTSNTPNTLLTITSIKFNVDPTAYEAIVLNGNFAREDVTMWGAAVWGSVDDVPTVITAKTSDTAIFDDVYTYGEVNRRSSPYVCFAQNVTERTTPGSGYAFSFWAKLSDDYAGAPAELRTVEFSPYYFDANGKENYNMTRTGVYKQELEPGVWTHFYGVVGLPEEATGFVIRILEQGTNYGQGVCLMGSYAVTGVSLSPAEYPVVYSNGGGSSSNKAVITKEATCEVGYAFKDLAIDWASATTSSEDNKLKVSFANNYDEVRLKLPRTLDMSTCAYINVSVASQNVPIAVKLYRKGQQVDVAYYNNINTSYLMVLKYEGLIDAIGIMSLATPNPANAYALIDGITFGLTQEPAPEEVSDTIVINGDFEDEDLSDWYAAIWGDSKITRNTSSRPIFGNTCTYATISGRTSPYQCFAQDITDRVKQYGTYTFSFWAKLSNDYKGAPENQRVVQFAPYTVDASGNADYNPKLDGSYAQVLEPGVWTYFEGTYKVTNANPISKVVIRILEQGTNYGQGDCVMGSFSIAGVRMEKYIPIPPEIDEDVPDLKDAMAETFGDDFITGTAVTLDELDDPGIELLINKHFNAVTLGNELKPDELFNYSNDKHTPLNTITFNGVKMEVPTLYFSRADEILDKLLQWNKDHPDSPIQVRGHVLVWHSQTPEWFFREGYTVGQNADGSENYVTPEVMNLRMEWYIKSVLEHYTGKNSPYKDLFYGWDVVNEAVNNGGRGYRTEKVSAIEPLSQSTHGSNSSWWAVYQSNEYIINAFRYANKYAPADLDLYYNDYNECDSKKTADIVTLLKDVKEAEGTRIDGMGMQGHYKVNDPKISDMENAIRAFAAVVGQVQFTELDLKASTEIKDVESQAAEYAKQAEYYHEIYMLMQKLNAEDGIEISGITFWGTVDKYSWLQSSSSVGGGSDGLMPQCPLLFDSNYRVKPAYWAFVDYAVVNPDWDKEPEKETEVTEQPQEETTEQSQEENVPESEAVVSETESEVTKKSSPFVPIAIAVGVVAVVAAAGTAVFFGKRKKSNGGEPTE